MPERFSASNAAKHMACPASANLELAIPFYSAPVEDDVIRASDVGTSAHEVFEKLMNYSVADLKHWITVLEYVAQLRTTRRFKVATELKVEATWLAIDPKTGKHPVSTLDLVLYTQDELHVLDLKWGKIPVPVHDNVQTIFYSLCAVALAPKAKGVYIHILQPRADNLDYQFIPSTDLKMWEGELVKAQARVIAQDVTFGPSDECKFCPAYPHSRSQKGTVMCPATLALLYPPPLDEDEILGME
jgi:hypothetical protein